jgi:hypothetical protein
VPVNLAWSIGRSVIGFLNSIKAGDLNKIKADKYEELKI